ncbi:interferon-inducible GTPase 5-like [Alligator mississippiensis]|uniref:Interferon-inducible GTPase 5-like n=1 Tax=Alligator mississippiensis TaxID=8496 RepID=A0A151PGN7_ALLMI|nr:interferon-inducible GTPase 5-like [Alligator mississippiensis]
MAQPPTADVAELAEVSVLVLGVPGCGKTALINAARGLAPTDPHAAPLEVPPAPGPPELHPDPTQPSLLLWERALVPGAEAWLAEADVVVVASAALFGPQEVAVAAAAREAGKTVIFVRTQADLALHTLRRLLGGGCEAREAALGALRQACTHALHSLGVPASPALFLICSLQPHGLDTPQLRATLLDEAQHCQRLLRPVLCDFEPGVVLWDLPTSAPDTLTTYDIILILATAAFGNSHMELGRVAGKHGYFIRAAEVLEEEEAAALRQASQEELAALGLPDALVFVLSTRRPERYDFAALWEALVRALPEEQARALTLALPPLTPALVEAKRRALHAEAWKVALAASLAAAVPVPGLALSCDVPLVLDALTTYRHALGLHAAGLAGLAARSGTTLSVLRAAVLSAPGRGLSRELVQGLLGRAAGGALGGLALELLVHRLPFCGALAAGGLTFRCTHALLGHCIEELAEDAHRVLCRAFGEPLPTEPCPGQG